MTSIDVNLMEAPRAERDALDVQEVRMFPSLRQGGNRLCEVLCGGGGWAPDFPASHPFHNDPDYTSLSPSTKVVWVPHQMLAKYAFTTGTYVHLNSAWMLNGSGSDTIPEGTRVKFLRYGPDRTVSVIQYNDAEVLIDSERLDPPRTAEEELGDEIEMLKEQIERQRMENREIRTRWENDIEQIGNALMEEAENRGWCEEYDDFVTSLNRMLSRELPLREVEWEVEVDVTYRVTRTITATSAEEAESSVEEDNWNDLHDLVIFGAVENVEVNEVTRA